MSDPAQISLEVCVASLQDAVNAANAGAVRVELNCALELGGLTPPIGMVEAVIEALKASACPVIAMVRPRPGDFVYTSEELGVMRREIDHLLAAGIDGIALGVLGRDNKVNHATNQSLIEPILTAGREAVFHRAFDLVPEPIEAIDALIGLGFHRVLTSGGKPSATQGADVIRSLIEHAKEQIQILPGGDITPANVAELIRSTGCNQVHASLRSLNTSDTTNHNTPIQFNSSPPPEPAYAITDANKLAAMVKVLNDY